MNMKHVAVLAMLVVSGCLMGGCGSEAKKDTQADLASFKGGPMPPEAKAKMEAAIEAAKNRSQEPHK